MVVEDVFLQSTLPQLLPAGASGGPPPLDWWPTQTDGQGDGGSLGPHVVERGGAQINRRGCAPADEALHRGAVEKHILSVEQNTCLQEEKARLPTHCQGDAHTGLGQRGQGPRQ